MTLRFHPRVEVLENRTLLSGFRANLTADSGTGSLRQVISLAQGADRLVVDDAGQSIPLGRQSRGLPAAGAVMLADLNRDGIPDLIVADTGNDRMLIYPGVGNDQFGPSIGSTDGFRTGTNPVGVTVADLTGDGLPDLVIANKGSHDVLILLNQSQGDSLVFMTGQRLESGSGPVSTVVSDFNRDGIADILVNRSGSTGVLVFLGAGGGVFDDQNAVVFSPASQPGSIFAAQFGGQSGLALVDSDANDLTRIANFSGPNSLTTISAPGDLDSATAFGFLREGMLALFDGGSRGVSSIVTETGSLDPMELAFSALTGGQGQFYTGPAGGGLAGLVALGLGVDTTLPLSTPESSNTAVRLVPLHDSLALVATVLTFTNEADGHDLMVDLGQTDLRTARSFLPGESVSLGKQQSERALGEGAERGSGEQTGDFTVAAANSGRSSATTWRRFVIGLDEALDGFRRENQGRISGGDDQSLGTDQEVSRPQTGSSSLNTPTSKKSPLELSARDLGHETNGTETATREAEDTDPTEASFSLVTAALISGWMLIARSTEVRPRSDEQG